MYIHIGGNITLPSDKIIGIFVTKDYVYISNVSVFTLKRRFADNEIRSEI